MQSEVGESSQDDPEVDDNKSHSESNNSVENDLLDRSVSAEEDCCETDDLNDQLHWAAGYDDPVPSEDNDVEDQEEPVIL